MCEYVPSLLVPSFLLLPDPEREPELQSAEDGSLFNMLWKSTGQEHYAHTRSAEQKTALLCTGAGTNQHDAYMKYMNALPHD